MNRQPQNQGEGNRPTQGSRQAQPQARQGARPSFGQPSVHPVRRSRAQRNTKKLRVLQVAMTVVIIAILIVGILLLTLPRLRVKTIEVEGCGYYQADDIIEASGIAIGDEIWDVRAGHKSREIDNRIYEKCPLVKSISISCGISKVTIRITEVENVMYTENAGEWYALDPNLQVWMKNAEESAFSPFLKVKLPAVGSISVGQKIAFSNANLGYGYIAELVNGLKRAEVLEHVTYIDFSDKFGLSCVIEDTFRIELGSLESLERKLECFYKVLEEKNSSDYAVINVSDPTKATYQKINLNDLYQ